MNQLLLILAILSSLIADDSFGLPAKAPRHEFKDLGIVELLQESPGEPISAPERLRVTIKCARSNRTTQVAIVRMCHLTKHEFDDQTKSVRLTLKTARVVHETGEVFCDRVEYKEIKLSDQCRDKK